MISQIKKYKVWLFASFGLSLFFLGAFLFIAPDKTSAQTCYTELSSFVVAPNYYSCPSPSVSVHFTSSTGVPINSPSSTMCFVGPRYSQGTTSITYRQENCNSLETLRINAQRSACEDEGGEFSQVPDPNSPTRYTGSCACPGGSFWNGSSCTRGPGDNDGGQPNYVENDCDGPDIKAGEPEDSENHCGILDYIVLFINILAALVGIVVASSIILAGIQYSTAGFDSQKVTAAKNRIRNALIALLFFIFSYALLNYLIPGGIFQ